MGFRDLGKVEDRLQWYERILRLNQKLAGESLESACRYLMDDAIHAARAEAGYFFVIDPSGRWHVLYARSGDRQDIPKEAQHFSESILKRALEDQAPVILEDVLAHPEFRQAVSVIAAQIKSVLAVPFMFNKKPVGLIYLENRSQKQYFAPELLEFLTLFSSQAAVLLSGHMSHLLMQAKGSAVEEQTALKSKNPAMQKIIQHLQMAAKSDSTVLLLGETGTGKEVMASEIHRLSARRPKHFVPINCAAIPETLIESELFGYKKGAFTGATNDRDGMVKRADGGTLFFDEIGDLSLHMQVKLLRVLQERKFTRLGSTQEEESDFRLICATHQPLDDRIERGLFRQDLYFRINTITLKLPPLRERLEDLPDLAQSFLTEACEEAMRSVAGFEDSAMSLLLQQSWPGNIRQLKNAIHRAIALVPMDQPDYRLTSKDFEFLSSKVTTDALPSLHEAKEEFIRNYVKKAILIHKGNKTKAAKALGVDPKTLYRHLLEEGEE